MAWEIRKKAKKPTDGKFGVAADTKNPDSATGSGHTGVIILKIKIGTQGGQNGMKKVATERKTK